MGASSGHLSFLFTWISQGQTLLTTCSNFSGLNGFTIQPVAPTVRPRFFFRHLILW